MTTGDKPTWRTTTRLPFPPTIRPSLSLGGSGGVSVFLYAIVAVALIGYGLYQMKAQRLDLGNWRVLVALGGAIYFAVRAAMIGASRWISRNDDDDKKDA